MDKKQKALELCDHEYIRKYVWVTESYYWQCAKCGYALPDDEPPELRDYFTEAKE